MQDGFAILRDEKAGGLLSPQERLELLQTHRKLVADREDVDEITNTFYGSLAHRNTAKEFSSKAQKFRKDVETPAEKAQMQYELRKAEREMVAPRRKPSVAQLDTSGANTIRVKNSGELTRKPTLLDYPSDAQRAPTVSPQSQRTRSLPEPKTPSAYPTPAADSVGEFRPALRRQKHILNPSADTYPNRRIPPHSRVEGQQYASAQPSDAQRFQPAAASSPSVLQSATPRCCPTRAT
ncbi:hypothetical protein C8R46DRAFT_405988 [Mycena filopes]|nr:hypothetical protein C8R46DRAFT_405988 [Mycena filopes]